MDFGRFAPGAEERLKHAKQRARQQNARSTSSFHDACERGEHRRVQQLVEAGQPINTLDRKTTSPAHYIAARNNDAWLLKYLLDHGADPLLTTDDSVSAAWISISKGYVEMLVILLSYYPKGHDVDDLFEVARSRRDWRCIWELERFSGVRPEDSAVPKTVYELPPGWAMGEVPSGVGGTGPLKPFYWKINGKGGCQDEPPKEARAANPLEKYAPYAQWLEKQTATGSS
ncbi:hypothetical protein AB1Y20_017309 [Prymnesium parvum]|uniref:Uncharacterized protein n=1 Tax=Prymnesium parvum TaxID=97485 RepID=A0AB34JMU2_PRYPA|mmetsp:Transcript_16846/g.40163  ORF Transcript_16846/g.40163 Transcript_16846/m.40163 type:complete len:229 (+) Transcript_16846:28-714(+)